MSALLAPLLLTLAAGVDGDTPAQVQRIAPLLGTYRLRGDGAEDGWLRVRYVLDGQGLEVEWRGESQAEVWIGVFDVEQETWWVDVLRVPAVAPCAELWEVEDATEGEVGLSLWSGWLQSADGERRRLAPDGAGGVVLVSEVVRGGHVVSSRAAVFVPVAADVESPWAAGGGAADGPHPDAPAKLGRLAFLIGDFSHEVAVHERGVVAARASGTRTGRYDLGGWCVRVASDITRIDVGAQVRRLTSGFLVVDPQRELFRYTEVTAPGGGWSVWNGSFVEGGDFVLDLAASSDPMLNRGAVQLRMTRASDAGYEAALVVLGEHFGLVERWTRAR